ncbi:MAG: ATP-binding protein [Alphaproteobacteria bacterium]|nr:ATP-binding protein [Alphaproteobacteria bacterium]
MTAGTDRVDVLCDSDIVAVQRQVMRVAKQVGLSAFAITKLVTATSELARNMVVHGSGGWAEVAALDQDRRRGVRVVVSDDGPGIADLEAAMRDGYSTGGGLGLGLPGARRLADEFDIQTAPGRGTVATIVIWRR